MAKNYCRALNSFVFEGHSGRGLQKEIELLSLLVTNAYLMLNTRNHWTNYYKWLQKGKWPWLALARPEAIRGYTMSRH